MVGADVRPSRGVENRGPLGADHRGDGISLSEAGPWDPTPQLGGFFGGTVPGFTKYGCIIHVVCTLYSIYYISAYNHMDMSCRS